MNAYVQDLSAEAVLEGAHERLRRAAQAIGPIGRESGGLTATFFPGAVPVALTACSDENTTALTLGKPEIIANLGDTATADAFAANADAIGFGRRGTLGDVLSRQD